MPEPGHSLCRRGIIANHPLGWPDHPGHGGGTLRREPRYHLPVDQPRLRSEEREAQASGSEARRTTILLDSVEVARADHATKDRPGAT